MPDTVPDQDPSIEEILASIRQIISDDDEEAVEETPAAAEPSAPEPEPISESEPEEEVLELTDDMADDPAPEPVSEPEPEPEIALDDEPSSGMDSGIISEAAAAATLSSLSKLTGNMPINRREGYSGVTVEDIVRELLNPMLREWVDGNLSPMVERLVQKELEKLARRAADD